MRWIWVGLLVVTLILVPFFLFEDYFNQLAAHITSGETSPIWASLAITALLASDVVLPIPSSIISAAAGALLGWWIGAATIWAGMMASCLIGYWIGAGSSSTARRFVGDDGLEKASAAAARYGNLAIVVCRPVPVFAEASVIFAGLTHMRLGTFLAVSAWSNLGVALVYGVIGAYSMSVELFPLAFVAAIVLPGMGALVARIWFHRQRAH